MKNLIVQLCIPSEKIVEAKNASMFSYVEDLYGVCMRDAKEYADSIEADYHVINTFEWDDSYIHAYQRFGILNNAYDQYDNIAYFDGDYTCVTGAAPDIFEIIERSDESFFAVPDNKYHPKTGEMRKQKQQIFKKCGFDEDFDYFNSGFFVMKKEARELFKQHIGKYSEQSKKWTLPDQDLMNKVIFEHCDGKYGKLSKNWNGVFAVKRPDFAIHYAGISKRSFSLENHEKTKKEKRERVSLFEKEVWYPQ